MTASIASAAATRLGDAAPRDQGVRDAAERVERGRVARELDEHPPAAREHRPHATDRACSAPLVTRICSGRVGRPPVLKARGDRGPEGWEPEWVVAVMVQPARQLADGAREQVLDRRRRG